MKKNDYIVPKPNAAVHMSAAAMIIAAALRIIYYTGVAPAAWEIWLQAVLPIGAALIFVVMLYTTAADKLYLTAIPVLMGCMFFASKTGTFTPAHRVFCLFLYTAVAALYYVTVYCGVDKRIFGTLIAAAMAYHIVVEDIMYRKFTELYTTPLKAGHTPWWHLMAEITVLFIMAALLCLTVAMKKRERSS